MWVSPFLVISFLSFMKLAMKDKNEITRNGGAKPSCGSVSKRRASRNFPLPVVGQVKGYLARYGKTSIEQSTRCLSTTLTHKSATKSSRWPRCAFMHEP